MERRYVELDHANSIAAELREDGAPTIRGVAAVFNKPSHDLGGFREILLPGAFDAVLASKKLDVVGLWNHDPSQILGRTTSGTLRLAVDETRGLTYEIDPPDTQLGRDCQTLLRRRDVFGSSFAFTVNPSGETWTQPDKGLATRTISAVSGLFDVSVVTHPAYPQTSVAVRSLVENLCPDLVINTAAAHNVPACEEDPTTAFAVNASGVFHLARACSHVGARLLHISTDYVFGDGH